jgi:hypothetical protein
MPCSYRVAMWVCDATECWRVLAVRANPFGQDAAGLKERPQHHSAQEKPESRWEISLFVWRGITQGALELLKSSPRLAPHHAMLCGELDCAVRFGSNAKGGRFF